MMMKKISALLLSVLSLLGVTSCAGSSSAQDSVQKPLDEEKAVTLLTTTDLRIGEIAEQCGYRHATHFMRQFKAQMGVTPSEYRSKVIG